MKKLLRYTQFLAIIAGALGATTARTALNAHLPRGEKIVEIAAPGKNPEICVVPKHFADATYSSDDAAAEAKLCAIDENTNAAVCPKTNSTNPGLDLHSVPPGFTPAQVAAANCDTQGAKKIAKYKLSTSCSYTPSILGYYHL